MAKDVWCFVIHQELLASPFATHHHFATQHHCFQSLWDVRNKKRGEKILHVLVVIKTNFQVVIVELNFQRVWVKV